MKKRAKKKPVIQPPEVAPNPPQSVSMDAIFQNPQDFQPSKILDAFSNPRTKQVMYELLSSLGDIQIAVEDNRPDWAKEAWKEFWRSLALMPETTQDTSEARQMSATSAGRMLSELARIAPARVERRNWKGVTHYRIFPAK